MSSDNRTIDLTGWRKKRTRTFTTSDGLELTLRASLTAADMIAQGIIPAPMVLAMQTLSTTGDEKSMLEQLEEIMPTINAVACAAVLRPRVLSLADVDAIIARLQSTYPDGISRELAASLLEESALDETPEEIASVPARLAIAREYAGALLVSEITFEDRQNIFMLLVVGAGEGQAAAPAAFPEPTE